MQQHSVHNRFILCLKASELLCPGLVEWTDTDDDDEGLEYESCACVVNEVIYKAKAHNLTNPEQPFFQRKKSFPG